MYKFFTTELHGGFHRVHEVLCVTLCFNSVFSVVLNLLLKVQNVQESDTTKLNSITAAKYKTQNPKLKTPNCKL